MDEELYLVVPYVIPPHDPVYIYSEIDATKIGILLHHVGNLGYSWNSSLYLSLDIGEHHIVKSYGTINSLLGKSFISKRVNLERAEYIHFPSIKEWIERAYVHYIDYIKEKEPAPLHAGPISLRCAICNGDETTNCYTCDGNGYTFCEDCSDGWVSCPECEGSGVDCEYCGGDGGQGCDYCGGSGTFPCDDCGESGARYCEACSEAQDPFTD